MTGICGWWGHGVAEPTQALDRMAGELKWSGAPGRLSLRGDGYALAAIGSPETVASDDAQDTKVVLQGHPQWLGALGDPAAANVARRFAESYRERGLDAFDALHGDFAMALVDLRRRQLVIAIDRMGVRNVAWQATADGVAFASNLDALGLHPDVEHRIAPQAIYDYLYFHMVPGPGTVFERSQRLLPGHCLVAGSGGTAVAPYWSMAFEPAQRFDDAERAAEFRTALRAGIGAFSLPKGCGTFLSGGTDSSSVTGLLAQSSGPPVASFSIGFGAEGYDEMSYARIAAARFATDHHEYYVTPADVEAALPWLASAFDGPFGNASAVPVYFCAKLAHDSGVTRLLAGDGGDELFGGNARYARQHQFDLYQRIPAALRSALVEPLLDTGLAASLPLLRKARSYVAQANMAMPARYESYNLLERLGPDHVLEPDFLRRVDTALPLARLGAWWDRASARAPIDRMLALDLKFTLADSDLPKVTRMCDRAGVDVAFPLLHDDVVAFSALLPANRKLRGTRLRPFFKEALRDVLPPQIIAKSKHGFGLPVGPWLAGHPPLNAMMREAMDSLGRRGIVRRAFIEDLVERKLAEHAGYYGTMLWILMMLELWLQRQADRTVV